MHKASICRAKVPTHCILTLTLSMRSINVRTLSSCSSTQPSQLHQSVVVQLNWTAVAACPHRVGRGRTVWASCHSGRRYQHASSVACRCQLHTRKQGSGPRWLTPNASPSTAGCLPGTRPFFDSCLRVVFQSSPYLVAFKISKLYKILRHIESLNACMKY